MLDHGKNFARNSKNFRGWPKGIFLGEKGNGKRGKSGYLWEGFQTKSPFTAGFMFEKRKRLGT
jgi:hypothetical protein